MTRKEFVEKFRLTKTKTKCIFDDGLTEKSRTLYVSKHGGMFVFYNNDLHSVTPYKENYVEGMEFLNCRLNLGYSCYTWLN